MCVCVVCGDSLVTRVWSRFIVVLFCFVLLCRWSAGVHVVELAVESNDGAYLFVGVIGEGWTDFATAFNQGGGWSLQADGYVYDNGSGTDMGSGAKLESGSRVTMVVDMDGKTVEFRVNGVSIKTCELKSDRVCPAVCFGGSGQLVGIQETSGEVAGAAGI